VSEPCDEGGEAPCFAHLFEDEEAGELEAEAESPARPAGNAGGRAAVADG
jgi:hypothetical protein